VLGVSNFEQLCVQYILRHSQEHPEERVEVISLGAGNAEIEIRIAQQLREHDFNRYRIDCIDLSPDMLQRGEKSAAKQGFRERFHFVEVDLARWQPDRRASIVIAHHSLHHIVELEAIFGKIKAAIGNTGYFLTSDMIGRNGHMRWPEAPEVVQEIWKTMPDRYKYNHQLRRFEKEFENWDNSKVGFEGIRAQDILTLLVKNFYFESFIAEGNLPDIFVERSFGHNFDIRNPEDIAFIDRVAMMNDQQIDQGIIKPTQVIAAMRAQPGSPLWCYKHWTPEFCVRPG
jgi:SAM-dependent methyltransferase